MIFDKEKNEINRYVFEFHEAEDDMEGYPTARQIRFAADIHQDERWPVVLHQFLLFLSSIYGYDINKKVILKSLVPEDLFETELPSEDEE